MRFSPLVLSLLLVAQAFAQEPAPAESQEAPLPPLRPEIPEPEMVIEAMKRAASFYRTQVAFAGGYAWAWPKDRSIAKGENRESTSLIVMQPPGTPSMGLAYLEAWQATGDPLFLQGAREAAQALIWCQLSSGGWPGDFDFDPRQASKYHFRRDLDAGETDPGKRSAYSSLDDNKTQSALLFLLELANTEPGKEDAALQRAVKFGMDGLLAAQAPHGAWPQQYTGAPAEDFPAVQASYPEEWSREFPKEKYVGYYTLNDGNLFQVARLLIRAHEITQEERYLDALKKLGDFHKLAQMPDPQPVWAQQYSKEMQPVWARKFEPPAVSSIESFDAMLTLIEIWVATGDKSYLDPIPKALKWFEKSRLPEKRWARFYELQTNTPLYCEADTYLLTYDDSNVPTHYGFKTQEDFGDDIEKIKDMVKRDLKSIREQREGPETVEDWAVKARQMRKRTWECVDTLDDEGRWMEDDMISAHSFVKNMRNLSEFVDSAKRGGEDFQEMLEKSIRKAEEERAAELKAAAEKAAAEKAAKDAKPES